MSARTYDGPMKPCAHCHQLMERREPPYEYARRQFCSRTCSGEAQRVIWTREEILKRVSIDDDGCWLWLRSVSQTGYARVGVRGRSKDAYRYFYTLLVGPIADGLHLDHTCHSADTTCPGGLCKHRLCVNLDHLEPVTHAENVRRGANGRAPTCPNGHPYSDENTWVPKGGGRRCRTCHRAKMRAYEARLRQARVA